MRKFLIGAGVLGGLAAIAWLAWDRLYGTREAGYESLEDDDPMSYEQQVDAPGEGVQTAW